MILKQEQVRGKKSLARVAALPKPLMILPDPPLGEEVVSPPSDGEAALRRAAVTPPESTSSKSTGLSSDGLPWAQGNCPREGEKEERHFSRTFF
jgi:hypothetical protein